MNARDNDPLHGAINVKLAAIVEASSTTSAWRAAWTELKAESTEEERLAVYQAVRDSGCLPAEAGFYLVSWQIDAMTSQDAEIRLCHLDEQMTAIEEAHGLEEDDFWLPGKAPKEYEKLRREYQAAWDEIFAEKLDEFGERHDMARLFRDDPDGFGERSEAGRPFFCGPGEPEESDAPEWLYTLAETVASSMTALSGPGPLGFLCWEEEGVWEIVSIPSPSSWSAGPTTVESWPPVSPRTWRNCGAECERVGARSPGSRWAIPAAKDPTFRLRASTRGIRSSCRCWLMPSRTKSRGQSWIQDRTTIENVFNGFRCCADTLQGREWSSAKPVGWRYGQIAALRAADVRQPISPLVRAHSLPPLTSPCYDSWHRHVPTACGGITPRPTPTSPPYFFRARSSNDPAKQDSDC